MPAFMMPIDSTLSTSWTARGHCHVLSMKVTSSGMDSVY